METCLLIQRRMRRAFRPRRRPWNSSRLRFRVEPRISSPLCRFEYTCVFRFVRICIRRGNARKIFFRDIRLRGMQSVFRSSWKGGKVPGLIRVVPEMENVGRADWSADNPSNKLREDTRTRSGWVARVYTGFERYYGVDRGQDTNPFDISLHFSRVREIIIDKSGGYTNLLPSSNCAYIHIDISPSQTWKKKNFSNRRVSLVRWGRGGGREKRDASIIQPLTRSHGFLAADLDRGSIQTWRCAVRPFSIARADPLSARETVIGYSDNGGKEGFIHREQGMDGHYAKRW